MSLPLSFTHFWFIPLSAVFVSFLFGCGGGGGGETFNGAARVSLDANPQQIDVGDRAQVRIYLSETNSDGVIVKVRFRDQLRYVTNSSFLVFDGKFVDIGPLFNLPSGGENYLIYFFEDEDLQDGKAELRFELEGLDEARESRLEVDVDVNDPFTDDTEEFLVEDPGFQPEAETDIEIIG